MDCFLLAMFNGYLVMVVVVGKEFVLQTKVRKGWGMKRIANADA